MEKQHSIFLSGKKYCIDHFRCHDAKDERMGGLQGNQETSKVPIIMLTAKGDEEDELTGFELGVDEYISPNRFLRRS